MRKTEIYALEKKWETALSWTMKALMLLMGLWMFYSAQDYFWAGSCIAAFVVSIIPSIRAWSHHTHLPWYFDLIITGALFLHVAGLALNFYGTIKYYDVLTHFVSSGMVAFFGFVIVFLLNYHIKKIKMDYRMFWLFVVMFAMALGVVWEFGEWGVDSYIYGYPHEQISLDNTMQDLGFDSLGGVIVATLGTLWLKSIPDSEKKRVLRLPLLEKELEKEL